jgi:hypothetical protein
MRTHASGAVKPASEWPTTTTPRRSPIAWTTASAYSSQPADSSSHGRSTATASCPCARSAGATRGQSHALPPPPWMSANVATAATLSEVPPANTSCRDERHRRPLVRTDHARNRIICVALHAPRALRRSSRALQRAPRFAQASVGESRRQTPASAESRSPGAGRRRGRRGGGTRRAQRRGSASASAS